MRRASSPRIHKVEVLGGSTLIAVEARRRKQRHKYAPSQAICFYSEFSKLIRNTILLLKLELLTTSAYKNTH